MHNVTIETYDFSHLTPDHSHVLVHVNVGKMPPGHVKQYLERFSQNFNLCKQLEALGINFSIVPSRDNERVKVDPIQEMEKLELNSKPMIEPKQAEEPQGLSPYEDAMKALKI